MLLELQVVDRHPTWVLRTELWSMGEERALLLTEPERRMLPCPLKSPFLPPASSNIVLANLCPVSKLAQRLEIWFGPNLSLTHQVWFRI